MKMTVSEMKRRNFDAGMHWFSKDTMNFFKTKIAAEPNSKNYFITSEHSGDGKRKYTIRHFDEFTSKVRTVGEFMKYPTLEEAKRERSILK